MTNVARIQWKQPLNNINLIMGNLSDDYMHGELTAGVLRDYVREDAEDHEDDVRDDRQLQQISEA